MRRSRQAKKHRLQKCSSRQKNEREPPQDRTPEACAADLEAEIGHGQGGRRFFACYLLTSLSPRHKGHTYIGFTVNPKRRIRQHNGEITSGAFRTKRKRPWEMVFCIHGFLTHVSALQFEWAWQHPKESLAVREAASTFKTLGGLANKIKLALTMLTLPSWQSMDLTVSFFSTAYMKHTAGCPSLPPQMKLHFCSMDELPCYWSSDCDEDGIDSNRSGDCGDLEDDMQVSSVDGTVEMSHSSVDTDRFSIENASENTWTLDQRDLGVLLLRESSPMVGDARVEADEQLVQSIHQTDPSDKESFSHPMLEEDMTRSAGSSGNKQIRHSSEIGTECQRDSFSLLKELEEPSGQASASVEEESLSTLTKNCAKEDKIACIVIDEDISEHRHPTCEHLPVRMRDDVWPSPMETVEVIDLFTPSPECRIISGSRKRRAARDDPDIIDLTRSPLFVQL